MHDPIKAVNELHRMEYPRNYTIFRRNKISINFSTNATNFDNTCSLVDERF